MADLNSILRDLQQQSNHANQVARQTAQELASMQGERAQLQQQILQQQASLQNLADALASVKASSSGSGAPEHVRYVDQIPGRRIPYTMLVQIPIGPNVTTSQTQTTQVSMDGPFVGVRRFAAFLSQHVSTYQDPVSRQNVAIPGRTFGRWRPCHSMWDINDSMAGSFPPVTAGPMPGSGVAIYASPSSQAGARSMQFDGLIEFLNEGASYPRQNQPIPSALYSEQINSPFDLAALDFFEKSEVLRWRVTPTHPNNPNFGNTFGFGSVNSKYPFSDGQFDVQEGLMDPEAVGLTSDPMVRLPNGVLYVGLEGYKIVQPPGVVRPV
jgi:hypothetical protein